MKQLVLWELSQKQNYIFKSNRLKECIGASIIIKKLSEDFSYYDLDESGFIIKGGGKSLYLFDEVEISEKFIRDLSLNIVIKYPGLEFFIVKQSFDFESEDIKKVINKLYKKLEDKKSSRKNSGMQIGFGIEEICASTGYPASSFYYDDRKNYISEEIKAKRGAEEAAKEEYYSELIDNGNSYAREIDDLVGSSSKSYISIVHIDGNGMGDKIKSLASLVNKSNSESYAQFNDRYIKVLKTFSSKISQSYLNAFKKMTKVVENNRTEQSDIWDKQSKIVPIRPLILAGDDITYLCNAYIGVETARVFIDELSTYNIDFDNMQFGKLSACAGIAITKKGYPFSESYKAAEELCQNAKKYIVEKGMQDASLVDFHIWQGDINKSINEIREKEYFNEVGKEKLTMKPLVLNSSKDWRNYGNFIESLRNIHNAIEYIGRSKIKALREVLKKGSKATEYFFKFYNIPEGQYFRDFEGTTGDYCFNLNDNTCLYLDAIEVMDMFLELRDEV